MAELDAGKVMIGLPDQLTTGAIASADVGTKLPESIESDISGFESGGYVSEDGLSLSTDVSTKSLKDWSGSSIRKVIEEFDGTISWTNISILDPNDAKQAYGDDNVEVVEANQEHGTQMKISIGAHLPEEKSWVFRMKDEDRRLMIVVPRGQVTSVDEITFNASDPVGLPITLSCLDDGTGNSVYIYTDDGQKVSA